MEGLEDKKKNIRRGLRWKTQDTRPVWQNRRVPQKGSRVSNHIGESVRKGHHNRRGRGGDIGPSDRGALNRATVACHFV